jgi:hypothetical protein
VTSGSRTTPLDAHYALTPDQIHRFRRDGFIKLPGVLDAATLERYSGEITRVTLANNKLAGVPLEQRTTYGKAFIQVTNVWRKSAIARELSFARRLARIAAELMGVAGVRMWHDQALYKEPGGGPTPWHVDQHYWPMASDLCCTAWIPLQPVAMEMGPMQFAPGSHRLSVARELAISDESEAVIRDTIARFGLEVICEPYALGDVSFHYGWTLHAARPNVSTAPRKVHTIIYMDAEMRLAAPANADQPADWQAFTPSTQVGDVMNDPLNPILYTAPG